MVMSGPCFPGVVLERPGAAAYFVFDPKLGKVMMLLPPLTETPGMAGVPLVPVPAPVLLLVLVSMVRSQGRESRQWEHCAYSQCGVSVATINHRA